MGIKNEEEVREESANASRAQMLLNEELSNIQSGAFQPNGDIMALLRAAARLFEDRKDKYPINENGEMLFPGWDIEGANPSALMHQNRIRDAAFVILGRDNPDSGMQTSTQNVSALVHYIADMLER